MIDFRHRKSESGQMFFLMQFMKKRGLHRSKCAFRLADFMGRSRRLDDAVDVFGVLSEAHHIIGQAADGAQHHQM